MENYFLLLYLLILSKYDCREKQVPSVLVYVGAGCALLLMMWKWLAKEAGVGQMAGVLPGLFLVLVATVTRKAGMADGPVLMIAGVVLGYPRILLVFSISLLLFCAISVVLLFLRKMKLNETLPYLPFLTASVVIEQLI